MATIPGIGWNAPRELTHVTLNAAFAVAEQLCLLGLGDTAVIHGSAATGCSTFVDTGSAEILMSDVDVILCASMLEVDLLALQRELSRTYLSAVGVHAGSNSRVSVKSVDASFCQTSEAPSLLLSARVGGCSAARLFRSPHAEPRHAELVEFPFALPYAVWHWTKEMDDSSGARATAVYELCKGLWRTFAPHSALACQTVRVISLDDGLRYLKSQEFVLRRLLPRATANVISDWLRSRDPATDSVASARLRLCEEELAIVLRRRWQNSILAHRMISATVRRSA